MEKELLDYPRPSPYCYGKYELQKRDRPRAAPDMDHGMKLEKLEASQALHDITPELFTANGFLKKEVESEGRFALALDGFGINQLCMKHASRSDKKVKPQEPLAAAIVSMSNDQTPAYRNLTSLFNSCEEQIGRRFNYCLLNAVSSSNFSTPEQAVMEIGRSTLLFVILVHALASEDLMVTSLVLNTASTLNLFDKRRSVPYLKDLLKTEFNLESELCAKAYSYGMRIKASGLLEIPNITLDVLKCFSEECEEEGAGAANVEMMEDGGGSS